MKSFCFTLLCFVLVHSTTSFSWNANGHRLIAQIAYDQLTPQAKREYQRYNHALDVMYKHVSWMNAAVWLDTLRAQNNTSYSAIHYINLTFSTDGTLCPALTSDNAITGIEQAIAVLKQANATDFDKGLALRILLHVVGDLHQPLHATSRVSQQYPQGDRGGQGVALFGTTVATNLHAYWDNGAGYLLSLPGKKGKRSALLKKARALEHEYPCSRVSAKVDLMQWANESHALGVSKAYGLLVHNQPDDNYQDVVKQCVQQRIALAGCRLGALLNQLASSSH